MDIDDVLPDPHFTERHQRLVEAPPTAVWAALHELRLGDLPLARTLMDIRTLPLRLLRRPRPAMVTGRFLERGPVPVLAAEPHRSIVAGGILQPWKPGGSATPPALDAAELRGFGDPGWVKCALDFVLIPEGSSTRVITETRVRATDARSRAVFTAYWAAIRLGSGLIRHELLRAVARRAEQLAAPV